ncbi:GPO family capsid scaffolding protein [Idiomarina sp.]|uniref:GPO family capsid scaffolding protein n=1 Tax=Idiomarina sp. TaxID=1874361 RepID=UPI003A900CE4
MAKSKFFRVATEGGTTDGRVIERSWLEQIAANYDQDKYGARVWLEHIRGLRPDSDFKAYGDVVAVKTEENSEGKLVLYAQIEPTESLVKLNRDKQKIYSSIEVEPNFSDTGEAYLMGLAVTDSPASLGTEMLAFSAKTENSPLAGRKQSPTTLFSAAIEFDLELEDENSESETTKGSVLLNKVRTLLSKHKTASKTDFTEVHSAVEEIATQTSELMGQYKTQIGELEKLQSNFNALKKEYDETASAFTELKSQLDSEPAGPQRPAATGGGDTVATDC